MHLLTPLLLLWGAQESDPDRARRLLESRKFSEAIEVLERIAERDPKAAWPWISLGYARTELGKFKSALDAYAAAREREPDHPLLSFSRGRTLAKFGRLEEGRRELERSLRKHPATYPEWTRYWLGVSWVKSDPRRALDRFEEAFERNPKALESELYYWRNVGWCLYTLARLHRAGRVYDEGLRKFPEDPWLIQMRALCHLRLGERRKAKGLGLRAEAALPKEAEPVTRFHLPFTGRWKVVQGNSGPLTHWGLTAKYSWDFVPADEEGRIARPNPKRLEDWFGWNAGVRAAADGVVVAAVDKYGDHPGPSREDPTMGNHVLVEHAPGEVSAYYHLRRGSVAVKPGQRVKRGHVLGRVGSSGFSFYPHLHFVVCRSADDWTCRPIRFAHSDRPVPQRGDLLLHPKD